jgi:NAD-dependent dihydropyrimidine dehydrogenase PreA subunit
MVPVAPVSSSTVPEPTGARPCDRRHGGERPVSVKSARRGVPLGDSWPTNLKRKLKTAMAYVIAEPCIGTKDNSCVEVCPVDCIHPTPDEPDYEEATMLYIDPEECIDCDACVEACPVDACFAEDQLPDEWQHYSKLNSDYYANR